MIGTVGLLRRLLGRITRIQLRKLQQSSMTISRTKIPQKLLESCWKNKKKNKKENNNKTKIKIKKISREGFNQKTILKYTFVRNFLVFSLFFFNPCCCLIVKCNLPYITSKNSYTNGKCYLCIAYFVTEIFLTQKVLLYSLREVNMWHHFQCGFRW